MALIAAISPVVGANGGTSASIDTTGATILVASVSEFNPNVVVVSDSKGNTWTPGPAQSGQTPAVRFYYAVNPTVGTGHTFTATGSGVYCVMDVQAHSGIDTVSPLDTSNSSSGIGFDSTNSQPGSITPAANGALIICGFGHGSGNAMSINSGMTITSDTQFAGGNNFGGSAAYYYQATAAAFNPLWSFTGTTGGCIIQAAFKAAAGGGTKAPPHRRHRPALTFR